MKKILLVTTDYPPTVGGVARYYNQLVNEMKSSVKVYVPRLTSWVWPRWLPWLGQVSSRVKKEQVDVLWVGQVLPVGIVTLILRQLGGKPYIVSTHGTDILMPLTSRWKRWLVQKVLDNALLVTVPSEFTSRMLIKHYRLQSAKVLVIYSGVTILPQDFSHGALFRSKYNINTSAPLIISVGRLVARKGFAGLLQAMPEVWQNQPSTHCAIIGNGSELSKLQYLAAGLERAEQIHFVMDSTDADLASAYAAATALVLSGRQVAADVEGFGMVCIEASNLGVPVIATETGGVAEAVARDVSGLLVPAGNTAALAGAIVRVLSDQILRQNLAEGGRRWAVKFNWSASANKLLTEIESRL